MSQSWKETGKMHEIKSLWLTWQPSDDFVLSEKETGNFNLVTQCHENDESHQQMDGNLRKHGITKWFSQGLSHQELLLIRDSLVCLAYLLDLPMPSMLNPNSCSSCITMREMLLTILSEMASILRQACGTSSLKMMGLFPGPSHTDFGLVGRLGYRPEASMFPKFVWFAASGFYKICLFKSS